MTERGFFSLKIPGHTCSMDIEAYECPICSIGLENPMNLTYLEETIHSKITEAGRSLGNKQLARELGISRTDVKRARIGLARKLGKKPGW